MTLSMALAWAAGLAALAYLLLRRRFFVLVARIPGPKLWLPVLGNVIDTLLYYGTGNIDWFWGYNKRYGKVYGLWVGSLFNVITSDPNDVEFITTHADFIDKGANYSLIKPWLGDGLLLSGGKSWHSRRKLLTPAFHFRILDKFVDVFNEKSCILKTKLQGLVGQGPVDVLPYISACTLDIICETAMGTSINAQSTGDSEYVKAVKRACRCVEERHDYPWMMNDTIYQMCPSSKDFFSALDVMHSTVKKVIKSRKAELQIQMETSSKDADRVTDDLGSKKHNMFIDQLLKMQLQGADLSEKDIFDEVNTFMFAGQDTTMTTLGFVLFLLAKHPAVQERVLEEMVEVTGVDTQIKSAHLSQLKYLDAVIKESLRMFPAVPVFIRECKSELTLPSGYIVPVGASVTINVLCLHYDENNFCDPHLFNPDRFMAGTEEKRHHFSYLPFSAGYRNCIGQKFAMQSIKTILVQVLRSFRFNLPSEDSKLELTTEILLASKSGIPLVIKER